ncbi:MAG: NADH:ubiquinone reductase (Na(+)-transporting) subunit C, partial [Sinobacterium sp.]|nr:NADH:ubiquinone reductase (Na(+)-transporting) subunit C [Sinobacterium sp.]
MFNKEALNTLVVALVLCLVCSVLVSTVAVALKPQQTANKKLDLNKNILSASGLLPENASAEQVNEIFSAFESKFVDIQTGHYAPVDSDVKIKVERESAPAGLGSVKQYQEIFVYSPNGKPELYVLPVYGPGLWGAMYGFLVLEGDLNTIKGLSFYLHKETPGLGAKVELDSWKNLWKGKQAYTVDGQTNIVVGSKNLAPGVAKSSVGFIDGLSGATLTTAGVNDLIRFWLGDTGFAQF